MTNLLNSIFPRKQGSLALRLLIIFTLVVSMLIPTLDKPTKVYASAPSIPSGWTNVFTDDFTGAANTGLNTSNWRYDIGTSYPGGAANWGTGEIESNTNSTANVFQDGAGNLNIKPIRAANGSWTSGRVETQLTSFQPPAGGILHVEANIQLPNVTGAAAQGYWPAFWMLGAGFRGNYTNWPIVGEIDIMENVNGINTEYATLHCGVSPGGPCNETVGLGGSKSGSSPTLQAGFHKYAMEFDKSVSPQQLRYYLDGVNFFTINANQVDATTWNNATNHGFFIILNVAIGGGWPGGPTASTTSGIPMKVDYVQVRTKAGGGATPTPVPTTTPVPSGDYSKSVTKPTASSALITFTSNVSTGWVDVHYKVNGINQQNFAMSKSGNVFTKSIAGLSAGNVVTYFFTYDKSGLAYDTAWFTHTQ